jgi:chromate transporter
VPLLGEANVARASLVQIAHVFTRYANLTFGGGSATIAVLREEVLTRRSWISDLQFQLAYALSRLTPGTNLLAFCTAVGWMTRRTPGAIVALAAASLPCSAVVVLASHFYDAWQDNALFRSALSGAIAAAVAVTVNTAWVFAAPHARAAPTKACVIVPGAIALVTFTRASSFQVLLFAAALGLLWPSRSKAA